MLQCKQAPTSQAYQWQQGADAKQWTLLRGKDRVGVYDMAKDVYRRVNTDGTLSDPAPRPWRTNPGLVPQPGAAAAKPAPAKKAEAKVVAAAAATEPAAEQADEAGAAGPIAALEAKLGVPRWGIYAAGGGLAGLVLMVGLVSQVRRK